jgi:hypothetical protein
MCGGMVGRGESIGSGINAKIKAGRRNAIPLARIEVLSDLAKTCIDNCSTVGRS